MGKKCGRCSTRYCGAECQKKHWEEGGHDQLCKKIKKAGGAEQYHADTKYNEAVAVAVEACADDNGRRGACSAARIQTQRGLRQRYDARESSSSATANRKHNYI